MSAGWAVTDTFWKQLVVAWVAAAVLGLLYLFVQLWWRRRQADVNAR
jgi:hypothetical protein